MKASKHLITKIEGHGSIAISLDKKKARLMVKEGERFFEKLLVGRNFEDAPFIVSRICGVCPTAHTIVSIKALENALGVNPPKKAIILRKIALSAQIVQSHALHLFFLVLPDLLKTHSSLDIAVSDPEIFKVGLELKDLGDDLLDTICGRSIHPLTPVVGGFTKEPDMDDVLAIAARIPKLIRKAGEAFRIINAVNLPGNARSANYLALSEKRKGIAGQSKNSNLIAFDTALGMGERNSGSKQRTIVSNVNGLDGGGYPLYDGDIMDNYGVTFPQSEYGINLPEKKLPYSKAKTSTYLKKSYMVGALPRLLISHGSLNPAAGKLFRQSTDLQKLEFDAYLNDQAQAIEIAHYLEEIQILLKEYIAAGNGKIWKKFTVDRSANRSEVRTASGPAKSSASKDAGAQSRSGAMTGAAAIEAPRGLLFNRYELDHRGRIISADIMTPTVQNLKNLEKDVEHLLRAYPGKKETQMQRDIEILIRAYDPCLTCSVH